MTIPDVFHVKMLSLASLLIHGNKTSMAYRREENIRPRAQYQESAHHVPEADRGPQAFAQEVRLGRAAGR